MGQRIDLAAWQEENTFEAPATTLSSTQFLMPGFIDCHIHAPQMPNIGLGLDMELLDWLNTYTFPLEAELADTALAQRVYEKVVVSAPWLRIPLIIKYGLTTEIGFGRNER